MVLRRLILEFRDDGIRLHTLYKRKDGPNPGTKARRREAAALARSGLTAALDALDRGDVADLGTSGFAWREDIIGLPLASSSEMTTPKRVKESR